MLMIKEYWNLIGQERFLAITWELDFSQACSFRRILMNHNNFYFTQIPGKTYDMFLAILVRFCPMGIFSQKNPALSHTTIYGPLTSCKVSEKNYWRSHEKLWTEGKMDGQTLFYWTLSAEAVVGGLTTSLQEVTGGNT